MPTVRLAFHRAKKILLTLASIVIFIEGAFAIVSLQFIVNAVFYKDVIRRQKYLDQSKKNFILLLVTILRIVAPSQVRITTENASIPKNSFVTDRRTGGIVSNMLRQSVIISNHQIYTDWVFLWWLAYTGGLAGNVFIMLKNSLERIPILGYGMRNYNFIFMNRKWEKDRVNLANRLAELDRNAKGVGYLAGKSPIGVAADGEAIWEDSKSFERDDKQIHWPYALILFPEGTNLSAGTRARNAEYAAKMNLPKLNNTILPRVTGLRNVLLGLKSSCEVVYDATIGYSGVRQNEYGQDIYRLGNIFLKGRAPRIVDIHLRAFRLDEIPIEDEKDFTGWLLKVWREKDELLDSYYATGAFEIDPAQNTTAMGWCKLTAFEMLSILVFPIFTIFLIIWLMYKRLF